MSKPLRQLDDIDESLIGLCACEDDPSRHRYLARAAHLLNANVVERLSAIVRTRVQVDINEGARAADAAVVIANLLDDPTSKGIALRARANVLRLKGQCRQAVELLDEAIGFFETAHRDDEVGRTLSTAIQPLNLLGQYDRAMASAARARRIFKRQKDGLRLARLELNVANVFHRQERFANALTRYEHAYQALLPYGDTEGIAVALHNLAVCLISLNDFDKALEFYGRALEFFRSHDLPRLAIQADYNIAYLYYLRGEYEPAIDRLRRTRENAVRQGDAYHAALCDLDLSEIDLEVNLSQDAVEVAERASQQFTELGMGYENARALINLAAAHAQMNQRTNAIPVILKAQKILKDEKHYAGLASAELYLAILRLEEGHCAEAIDLCKTARRFFESAGLTRKTITCDLLLGRAEMARHDHEAARGHLENAIFSLKSFRAPFLNHQAQLMMGRIHELAGERAKSFRRYERARKELDKIASSLHGEDLKIAFMGNKLDVYERLVQSTMQQALTGAPAARALGYIEQAKGRVLRESLLGRAQPLATRMMQVDQLCSEIVRLRGHLNWLYHRIDQEEVQQEQVSPDRIRHLWKEARECEKLLVRRLQETPGLTKPVASLPVSPVNLSTIRAALPESSVLIEYCEVDQHIVAAVLSRDNVDMVPLASSDELKQQARMLRFHLFKFHTCTSFSPGITAALISSAERHLENLYRLLVAPLASLLSKQHLVIVPHGVLHALPFGALFDGNEYLIDRHTISYAPSASIYALCQARNATQTGDSLVMGVHDSKAPWILHEARNVAKVVKHPNLLLGREASYEALRRCGPHSRRIHLATHGMFRQDNPMFSSVRLSDSHLSGYDLYGLHLPVDLFALSGCATGLNVVGAGDELMGLARGLLYAGASTLLLTLWNVNDQSSADFMNAFYTELDVEGKDKASALRLAALRTRERYPHPYHWGPFVLIGRAPN